jgi:multisubunit Na+/H+ antiporter MnhC subunit
MTSLNVIAYALMGIGLFGLMTQRNMIKMVLSLTLAETGLQLLMVNLGYLHHRTAPILDQAVPVAEAAQRIVDPVPQALVLTAIVIGVAVNALMLTLIMRLYREKKTLDISKYKELRW